jgi:hypothetical protein
MYDLVVRVNVVDRKIQTHIKASREGISKAKQKIALMGKNSKYSSGYMSI